LSNLDSTELVNAVLLLDTADLAQEERVSAAASIGNAMNSAKNADELHNLLVK
jgi:hypothetical protein